MTQLPPPRWPPPAWAPAPPRQRHPHHHRRVAHAIAIGALLLAGVGGAVAVGHDSADGSGNGGGAPRPGTLAADVPQLEAFVAKDRGLAFVRKVKVVVLSRQAFTAYVEKNDGLDDVDRAEAAAYQALGLIDDADAYVQHLRTEQSADVDGLYENGSDTIRVAAVEANAYTRSVLAHELTHALDDQHFRLSKVQDRAFSSASADDPSGHDAFFGAPLPDLVSGVDGLLEGDAERVRDDYLAQLSPADQAAEQQQERAAGDAVPFDQDDAAIAPLTFLPYVDGVTYTRALLQQGGQAALDAAFGSPPVSSQQVLHPGDPAPSDVAAAPSPPNGDYLATGSMGEAGLAVVLGEVTSDGDVRSTVAQAWQSDRFAVSRDGAKACAHWVVALSGSPAPVVSALRTALPAATVSATGSGVDVQSCR